MPRLGQHIGVEFFGIGEGRRRPVVTILRLDFFEQARNGLHVVVQDLGPRVHDDLQRLERAFEVGDQHLDRAAGVQLADAADDHGKDRRAAVAAFVAVDGGDHGVLQVHRLDRLRHALRFQPVHRAGLAVLDVAEDARARAHVAQHQEGGGAAAPAFAHVRAHGLLAHRVQRLGAHQRVELFVGLARRRADADPFGAAQGFVGAHGRLPIFSGSTRSRVGVAGMEEVDPFDYQ